MTGDKWVWVLMAQWLLSDLLETQMSSALLAPYVIQAAMACNLAQPKHHVGTGLDIREIPIQAQKDVLGQFLGNRPVAQEMVGHAIHESLVVSHSRLEFQLVVAAMLDLSRRGLRRHLIRHLA